VIRHDPQIILLLSILLGALNAQAVFFGDAPLAEEPRPSLKSTATCSLGLSPVIGWRAIRLGLPERELKRQLGSPRAVEGRSDYEVWSYITGIVLVSGGKVIAWRQVLSP
jgi:hypothetical protein